MLKSYIFNDIGHLYKDAFSDKKLFLENLTKSVENRKKLHQTFVSNYPKNIFLATKLEQEYIIALSEQCNYMENSVIKTMQKNIVMAKFEEWEKEPKHYHHEFYGNALSGSAIRFALGEGLLDFCYHDFKKHIPNFSLLFAASEI